jgi:hypothetical protein
VPSAAVAFAAAATMTVILAACGASSAAVTGGPLGGAVAGGGECAPAAPGGGVTFGIEDFQNTGHSTLVLDSVALRHPRGLRLVGAYADPGQLLMGAGLPWPPEPGQGYPIQSNWKYRRPVRGFRLAPGQWFNMVIGVTAPRRPGGSTSGLVVRYHDSAGSYVVQDHFGYQVLTRASCPAG